MKKTTRTALLSVYNKDGIVEFAKKLTDLGFNIVSSGGTYKHLIENGVKAKDVAEITGMEAILSHRVVTLHPKIHGGLLADEKNSEHTKELEENGIELIDLVCVDFYPLSEEIKKDGSTKESVIEKTDIGGPTMVRAGAKAGRIVVCDKADREKVLEWLTNGEENKEEFIEELRAKAEYVSMKYISDSALYHGGGTYQALIGEKSRDLKYGENAYQSPSALYDSGMDDDLALSKFVQIEGTLPSYNNYCDLERMLETATHIGAGFETNGFGLPHIVIGVKHGNACGASYGDTHESAEDIVKRMLVGDLRAIHGGSVLLNFAVTKLVAETLIYAHLGEGQKRRLLDTIIAPSFDEEAIEILARKEGKCRLLENKALINLGKSSLKTTLRIRQVRGGFLTQPEYSFILDLNSEKLRIGGEGHTLSEKTKKDLILAWAVGATSNSNTITLVKNQTLRGNGVGQQDRVGACELALKRAGDAMKNNDMEPIDGAVAYSDSFFPFPDGPETLLNAGIKTILATSGSVNDEKVFTRVKELGGTIITLPDQDARGFFGH